MVTKLEEGSTTLSKKVHVSQTELNIIVSR